MMNRHHVILTCCCILLIHRIPVVSSGTLSSSLSSADSSPDPVIRIRTQGSRSVSDEDLEFSDTSHGEVTNSDQQVVYINHGGGAVSSIRRSFAVPFTPHVSSYPSTLFEGSNGQGGNSDPDVGPEYRREVSDAGFARRAGGTDEERPFDGNFDDHHINPPESFAPAGGDPAAGPLSHDEPASAGHQPMHPAPLGLPVPPTSFGSRTAVTPAVNNINHNNPVSHHLHDHRIAEPDQRNQRINFPPTPKPFNQNTNPIAGVNNVHYNNHQPNNNNNNNNNIPNNNINRINPLLNAFSPIASGFPQALNPDFFNLFDAPFAPIGAGGFPGVSNNVNDNLFQRRRLSIQNTPNNEISHNSLAPASGYPNYNYYAGNENENDASAKWPKIFKFSDGRINLYEFEKDKKIGRIKFSKDEDPLFDGVRRDSFLILHGGTYS